MYRVPIEFHNRVQKGDTPIPYVLVTTHMGSRAYAERELRGVFSVSPHLADGSILADSSHTAGSESAGIIEKSARIMAFGTFERTIKPKEIEVLAAFQRKQMQHITLTFTNADRYFSRMLPKEPWITRPLAVYLGFDDLPQSTHLRLFSGTITMVTVKGAEMEVEADEQ